MQNKRSIFVVDDEAEARKLLKILLEDEGYDVTLAVDGDDAVAQLEKRSFDLLLLDIKMPHLSGFDVLMFVRDNHPGTKVVMLTGYAELANAMESRMLGADAFIGKPYDPNEVLMEIEKLLPMQ